MTTRPEEDIRKHLQAVVRTISRLPPEEQFTIGGDAIKACRSTIAEIASLRSGAVRTLRKDYSLAELAEMFGVSSQRIAQMVDR